MLNINFKLVGAALILISGTGMGVYFAGNINYRIKHLRQLLVILNKMMSEIRFASASLVEISDKFGQDNGIFSEFFRILSTKMNSESRIPFCEVWSDGVDEGLKDTCLTKEDKQELKQLGDNLGSLDLKMQLDSITMYKNTVEEQIRQLVKTSEQKTKLCYSMGILGSLFIIILLY